MLSETLLRHISDTGEVIGLDEAVIEKDYYVTQVIHQLSDVENEYFRLVFCGGTCLAKAHKLVKRMSEDVDFKVQLKSNENFSKSRLKNELKKFREQIRSTLSIPDLTVTNDVARNEGRYQQIILQYPHSNPMSAALRPDIKVEFTYSKIQLPTNKLQIKTLIEDTLNDVILFQPTSTNCISTDETAIEKWVGLTRRIMAIERGYEDDDKTLIRHVYDLNAINRNRKITWDMTELAKKVINADAEQFKNLHPEYAMDTNSEIRQSLILLKEKQLWKERYDEFIENMVYEPELIFAYGSALAAVVEMSDEIIKQKILQDF